MYRLKFWRDAFSAIYKGDGLVPQWVRLGELGGGLFSILLYNSCLSSLNVLIYCNILMINMYGRVLYDCYHVIYWDSAKNSWNKRIMKHDTCWFVAMTTADCRQPVATALVAFGRSSSFDLLDGMAAARQRTIGDRPFNSMNDVRTTHFLLRFEQLYRRLAFILAKNTTRTVCVSNVLKF